MGIIIEHQEQLQAATAVIPMRTAVVEASILFAISTDVVTGELAHHRDGQPQPKRDHASIQKAHIPFRSSKWRR
jgi:hypothetical protein